MPVVSALTSLTELRLPPDLAAFREAVRDFLREEMAAERTAGHFEATDLTGLDIEFERAHQRRAGAHGFLGISAPREFGGGGKPASWKAVYDFEAGYCDAPSIDTAFTLCAAPILRFGSAAQRNALLPPMIRGEVSGCIAYTERDAGSDLAVLSATGEYHHEADRAGTWRLRGEKTLVTGGHKADICCTIVRTEPGAAARDAMSLFVLPLPHPGVTVRRRPTANAWTLSELNFDAAEVPEDALLGRRGAGWAMVLAAFGDERAGFAWLGWATRLIESLLERYSDPRIAQMVIELGVARRFCQRFIALQDAGQAITYESSVAKVYVTELLQRIARLGAELEGPQLLRWSPLFRGGSRFAYEMLERIHCTISVGANEVQRDGIARLALKLPRS
jgi:alkylation response protein AidB-like acyl-CoA dehydrogenase